VEGWGLLCPLWCALASLGHSVARVKNLPRKGLNVVSPKVHLGGSKLTCSSFLFVDQSLATWYESSIDGTNNPMYE